MNVGNCMLLRVLHLFKYDSENNVYSINAVSIIYVYMCEGGSGSW